VKPIAFTLLLGAALMSSGASRAQEATVEPVTNNAGPSSSMANKGRAQPSATAPAAPSAVAVPSPKTRGSMYSAADFQSLTADRRRYQVGDVVTVLIFENSSASSSADTGAAREANAGVALARTVMRRSAGITTNNEFNGQGRTQRTGRILAQLTVSVQEIAANRDLLIAGEQNLEINGEKQMIRLEGRVRPADVNEQNTVMSTRVADAKIAFIGDGVVSDLQRPGWWQQVLGLFGL
jgi:flagellar L-ring protein FlgH